MQLVSLETKRESEKLIKLMVDNGMYRSIYKNRNAFRNFNTICTYSDMPGFWTSGVDRQLDGKWRWEKLSFATSLPIEHFNWCTGDPDNYDGNDLFILVRNKINREICWEDAPGDARWPAICKPILSTNTILDNLMNVSSQLAG